MKKIGAIISLFLERVWGKMLIFLVSNGEVAIKVTNIVKAVIENPAVNWAVAMTPTSVDDAVLAKAKQIVPKVVLHVGLAMGIIRAVDESEDAIEASAKVIEYVRMFIPEHGKGVFYRELSGKVLEALSDGKVSIAEAVGLVQLIFKGIIKT
jgi:hypothetical protein